MVVRALTLGVFGGDAVGGSSDLLDVHLQLQIYNSDAVASSGVIVASVLIQRVTLHNKRPFQMVN